MGSDWRPLGGYILTARLRGALASVIYWMGLTTKWVQRLRRGAKSRQSNDIECAESHLTPDTAHMSYGPFGFRSEGAITQADSLSSIKVDNKSDFLFYQILAGQQRSLPSSKVTASVTQTCPMCNYCLSQNYCLGQILSHSSRLLLQPNRVH